ncbi:MAG: glycosyltransferase family 9 protein [Chloroflexota bacterium]
MPASGPVKIFVYRPGAIGDTVLTLPALAALRGRFPGCRITYAGNAAMLPLLPVEQAISADDPRLLPLFGSPPRPFEPFDLQVIFARRPTGLEGIRRDPLAAVEQRVHIADWLTDAIDPDFEPRTPRLSVTPARGAELVLHPGAGAPSKRWPLEHFLGVARELDLRTAVVVGPAEEGLPDHVELLLGASGSLPVEIWRGLSLPELAARIAASSLFLGNDSGPTHLAAALDVPTVGIYPATDPLMWGIRGPRVTRLTEAATLTPASVAQACRHALAAAARFGPSLGSAHRRGVIGGSGRHR